MVSVSTIAAAWGPLFEAKRAGAVDHHVFGDYHSVLPPAHGGWLAPKRAKWTGEVVWSCTNPGEVVKRLGRAFFILFFLVLIVVCSFDGPAAGEFAPLHSHDSGSFCGIIHAANALTSLPSQPALHACADEAVRPPSDIDAIWSLIHAIDHPPRLLGRLL